MLDLGTIPDRPAHGCAFCGGVVPPVAPEMITVFLGDPAGRCSIVWCHRGCLAERVQPDSAAHVEGVAAGDFLPEHVRRRRSQ